MNFSGMGGGGGGPVTGGAPTFATGGSAACGGGGGGGFGWNRNGLRCEPPTSGLAALTSSSRTCSSAGSTFPCSRRADGCATLDDGATRPVESVGHIQFAMSATAAT